jgi:hypothetical protein
LAFSLGGLLSFFTGRTAAPTLTAGGLQIAAGQIADLSAALSAHLANMPADEVLTEDILLDAAMLAGGPWALAAPTLVPLLVPLIFDLITKNQSAMPGALATIGSGKKGSNPNEPS